MKFLLKIHKQKIKMTSFFCNARCDIRCNEFLRW